MSISNLIHSDINAIYVPCTVSGAITGSILINLKRINNIVYLSLPIFSGTASATSSIVITPNISIPIEYSPVAGIIRVITLVNNATPSAGFMSLPNTFSTITLTLLAGGNFAGTSAIIDTTVMWAVLND